jgi:hypothetical protein
MHVMFLEIFDTANAAQSTVSRFLDIEAVHDSGEEESSDYESGASAAGSCHIFSRITLISFVGAISDDEEDQHRSNSHQLCRWDDLTASEETGLLERLALDIRRRHSSKRTGWDALAMEPECARPTKADPNIWRVLVKVSDAVLFIYILTPWFRLAVNAISSWQFCKNVLPHQPHTQGSSRRFHEIISQGQYTSNLSRTQRSVKYCQASTGYDSVK